jgi:hypothetical protein
MTPTTAPSPPSRAPSAPAAAVAEPGVGDFVSETLPLAGSVAFYGPPVAFLAGPWVLLGLMLMGPFALLVTFVVAAAAAVALLAGLVGAVVVAPYLLVHRLSARRRVAHPVAARTGAVQIAPADPGRAGFVTVRFRESR